MMLMAIYHLHCKIFSRSKGQTAIAAAAYRSGTKLEDHELGIVSDYTKKKWRKRWADICNEAIDKKNAILAEENLEVNLYAQQEEISHIDHRSFVDRNIFDRVSSVHIGWQARKMEQLGMKSDRMEQNRRINQMNSVWSQLNAVSKKYRKNNKKHYQNYQEEVQNHDKIIRDIRSSSVGSKRTTGYTRENNQNDVYAFAGYPQTEPASYGEITAMSRRDKSSEGSDSGGLKDHTTMSDIIMISDLIDDANSSMENEAESLVEAIIDALFSSNKKKKKHGLQLVR